MSQSDIRALERDIETAKKQIDVGNALERLRSNRDFKKIIEEGYFERNAIRLVGLLGAPDQQTAEKQTNILREMHAIGALKDYFKAIEVATEGAKRKKDDDEETLVSFRMATAGDE